MGIETALIIGAVAAAGAGAYQARESREARKDAKEFQSEQLRQADAGQRKVEDSQRNASQVAEAAAARRRQSQGAALGRRSTMLTGSQGVLGQDASAQSSTILGG